MKCSSKTLQDLPYFWNMKTHVDIDQAVYLFWKNKVERKKNEKKN